MAIGRISGQMLFSNLERQGIDLAFDSNLIYLDVNNRRVGINANAPQYSFDVNGNVRFANLYVLGDALTSDTGRIDLGSSANVVISGGSQDYVLYTDGNGNLQWGSVSSLLGVVPELEATNGSFDTLTENNFSTANAVISGGYVSGLTNLFA